MKRSRNPIIWRDQGGAPRAYGDFRFLGGSREALCLPGTKRGVTDPELAEVLGSEALVKRIYGHLGTVRHRAKVVEYRVEQHRRVLKAQLAALCVGAGDH